MPYQIGDKIYYTEDEVRAMFNQAQSPYASATSAGLTAASAGLSKSLIEKLLGKKAAETVTEGIPTAGLQTGGLYTPATLEGTEAVLTPAEAGIAETSGTGLGSYILPGAAALIGAAMMRQGYRKRNPLTGAIGGAGLGYGAASLANLAGLATPLAPFIIGGTILGGLGGLLKHKPKTRIEEKRLKKLYEQGIIDKTYYDLATKAAQAGREKGAVEFDTAWREAKTPEEKAKLLWGYAGFSEKFGRPWWEAGEKARMEIAKLFTEGEEAGAFREHHGTVDLNWTPEKEEKAKQILEAAMKLPKKEREKRYY